MAKYCQTFSVLTTSGPFTVNLTNARNQWMYLTNTDAANNVHVNFEAAAVIAADDSFCIPPRTTLRVPRADALNAIAETSTVKLLVNGIS